MNKKEFWLPRELWEIILKIKWRRARVKRLERVLKFPQVIIDDWRLPSNPLGIRFSAALHRHVWIMSGLHFIERFIHCNSMGYNYYDWNAPWWSTMRLDWVSRRFIAPSLLDFYRGYGSFADPPENPTRILVDMEFSSDEDPEYVQWGEDDWEEYEDGWIN